MDARSEQSLRIHVLLTEVIQDPRWSWSLGIQGVPCKAIAARGERVRTRKRMKPTAAKTSIGVTVTRSPRGGMGGGGADGGRSTKRVMVELSWLQRLA